MKKHYTIILCLFSFCSAVAQPKLVTTLNYWGVQNGGAIVRTDLPGLTPGTIHPFDNSSPNTPSGGVIAGDGNWLYGITRSGGANNAGVFYRVHRDGTLLTTLYHFSPGFAARTIPNYNTDDGMVYVGDNSTIRVFNTANNSINTITPLGPIKSRNLLIPNDGEGWIYYVEQDFPDKLMRMQTIGGFWETLHVFTPATEGDDGIAGVTEVPGDSLYGVQMHGGLNSGGTIYCLRRDGSDFAVVHQFTNATGIYPESRLVYFDGKLYGTTTVGGNFNKGVLFCINSDGTNYRVLRHFDVGDGTWTEMPFGNISIASNGRIFGSFVDFMFSNFNYYYLYKIDTSGQNFEPIFTGDAYHQRINGESAQDPLLLNDDEIFFPTWQWGRNEGGVLNHCDTSGTGNDIFQFGNSINGFRPTGLIKASDGKLYGTTTIGGPDGAGVIFSVNADGTGFTRLHQLTDAEGFQPSGKLYEASDGKLYGACRQGGANNVGCLFRINKNGSGFQVIYSYVNYTGAYSPVGGLVEDNSGALYGTNFWPYGSIFKVNKDGSNYTELKVLVQNSDLNNPYQGLRLIRNYLYGVCGYGGTSLSGGLFRIKTDGTAYEVLHEFSGSDGQLPVGSLTLASNGKLYGTATGGGTNGNGVVFRIDTTGANFTVLKSLSTSEGTDPWAALIQASDGLIYGGTQINGPGSSGTLFKMNLDGTGFAVIKSFDMNTEGQGVSSVLDLNINVPVLPVELVSFDAEKKGQSVLVTWKTAQEQNSDRFEVERSNNGVTFKLIGTVASAGNSTITKSYSLIDNNPLAGVNYYRLKQIDIDGSATYSRVASVNFDKSIQVSVFPNPASDRLFIRMPDGNNFSSVRITDASGKLVLQKDISSTAVELDVRSLPKGWYVIQLSGDDKAEKIFVKE